MCPLLIQQQLKLMDRITQLQTSHDWLSQEDCRWLLIDTYHLLAHQEQHTPEEVRRMMGQATKSLCSKDRDTVETRLHNIKHKTKSTN